MDSNSLLSSLLFCSFGTLCIVYIYLSLDSIRFTTSNFDLDIMRHKITARNTEVYFTRMENELNYFEDDFEMKRTFEMDDKESERNFKEKKIIYSKPRCNCNNEKCLVKFLARFKGIETFPVEEAGMLGFRFIGSESNLELMKWELKKNEMSMIFGEPLKALDTVSKRNIADFLDAFTGIEITPQGNVKFIGEIHQLVFVKRKLKEYNFQMIFGELEEIN